MKVSLIISIYKNIEDLKIVLQALQFQTYPDFEIIISEDGQDMPMWSFLRQYNQHRKVIHITQPDKGWRKNRALNNAIRHSSGDYLIFIDGDCILHHKFIEHHVALARPDRILAGKRIKFGIQYSNKIRLGSLHPLMIQHTILKETVDIKKDRAKFIEEGIYINPKSLLGFVPRLRPMRHLKGCNMSFFREAVERVNGFDEDYVLPAVGEDADLAWRFQALNFKLYSLRNIAVQYHLYHPENWTSQNSNLAMMKCKMNGNKHYCVNGFTKMKINIHEHHLQNNF
jgi:cellulose synthase/poly-beta-1,6-N-acetylglucosamine synthase-like glycosyltransferase